MPYEVTQEDIAGGYAGYRRASTRALEALIP